MNATSHDNVAVVGTRKIGTVKWFDGTKGYGFIRADDGEDTFVHIREARASGIDEIFAGDRVDFELGQPSNGKPPRAINLVLVRAAAGT